MGLKTSTLQKIGKAWRDHKCRLKTTHYIPHIRNKAQVKSDRPRGCILEDWDVLVDHWYSEDAMVCIFLVLKDIYVVSLIWFCGFSLISI